MGLLPKRKHHPPRPFAEICQTLSDTDLRGHLSMLNFELRKARRELRPYTRKAEVLSRKVDRLEDRRGVVVAELAARKEN